MIRKKGVASVIILALLLAELATCGCRQALPTPPRQRGGLELSVRSASETQFLSPPRLILTLRDSGTGPVKLPDLDGTFLGLGQ